MFKIIQIITVGLLENIRLIGGWMVKKKKKKTNQISGQTSLG